MSKSAATSVLISAVMAISLSFLSSCSDKSRDQFDNEVAGTLDRRPELVKIALLNLADKEEKARSDRSAIVIEKNIDWIRGIDGDLILNRAGRGTVTILSDFQCPYCKAITPKIFKLAGHHPNTRFIFKDLAMLGPDSVEAAFALSVINLSGKDSRSAYLRLMSATKLSDVVIREVVSSAGVPASTLSDPDLAAKVRTLQARNQAIAKDLGVEGTPTIIFDRKMVGADKFAELENYVKLVD